MSCNAIELQGVWKFFGDFAAVRDVSFALKEGSCLALFGRNGAGKTTLLRIMAGLLSPTRGRILVFGESPSSTRPRSYLGVLGHGTSLYDEMSARENLRFFGRLYGVTPLNEKVEAWLDQVGLLEVANGRPAEFSRGMRQRLAIARVMLHQPKVLLLDEPFTGLDDRASQLLHRLLQEHLDQGGTIVLTSHQVPEALRLASHVALLEGGRLVHFGLKTTRMLEHPEQLYDILLASGGVAKE